MGVRSRQDVAIFVDKEISLIFPQRHHCKELFNLVQQNRSSLRQWLPWLDHNRCVEDQMRYIASCQKRFECSNELTTLIVVDQKISGVIGFHSANSHHRSVCIGYWLGENQRGFGVMTKSCRAFLSYGFKHLGFNRIEIKCATGNLASQKIPQRLNLLQEGCLRQAEWLYDHFVDLAIFSVLKTEWDGEKRREIPISQSSVLTSELADLAEKYSRQRGCL